MKPHKGNKLKRHFRGRKNGPHRRNIHIFTSAYRKSAQIVNKAAQQKRKSRLCRVFLQKNAENRIAAYQHVARHASFNGSLSRSYLWGSAQPCNFTMFRCAQWTTFRIYRNCCFFDRKQSCRPCESQCLPAHSRSFASKWQAGSASQLGERTPLRVCKADSKYLR